jgi:apolipoprotein N-acyltransferase
MLMQLSDPPGKAAALIPPRTKQLMVRLASERWLRRSGFAFMVGALSALIHAPTHLWPVLFVTFPVLVWLIDTAPGTGWRALRASAATGWWFGFGYFLLGLYWMGHAFLVEPETFGWLLPIAVTTVPAGLAIFTAAGVGFARAIWTRGPTRILALAVALTVSEWLRGHVLTGFPWNAFGYALTGPNALAQAASLVGLWGLTFLSIAIFASPATLLDEGSDTRRPWLPPACALALLAALAVFGWTRLALTPTSFVKGVELRVMQPNLPEDQKFNYSAKAEVMERYLRLSAMPSAEHPSGLAGVTHLIWPESPFPFYLARESDVLGEIATLLPEGTVLITGADRSDETTTPNAMGDLHNSMYVINHRGMVLALYDKVHLVPFGEFLPLQSLLERLGFMQLTKVEGGYASGDRRALITVPGAPPLVPLICYEVIFPGEVVPRGERPGWMLNLTNDGWFGMSSGPYQHFQQARLRAIEEGLPLVRAANTGISAVFDPLGRVVRSLRLGAEGVLDAPLPQPIAPTLYARLGDLPATALVVLAFAIVIRRRKRA